MISFPGSPLGAQHATSTGEPKFLADRLVTGLRIFLLYFSHAPCSNGQEAEGELIMRVALCFLIACAAMAQSPHFDAASVKVVVPDGRGGGGSITGGPGTSDPGRLYARSTTIQGLLIKAFGLGQGQLLGAAVQPRVGGKFYEVTATMPPDTTTAQFQAMLQNLLVERFHLVVHHETRDFPAYELVIDKGGMKLKEAAATPDDGPPPSGSRVIFSRAGVGTISMKAKTMADLADRLATALLESQMIATQKMNSPSPRVVDKTGLTGRYNFELEYSRPLPPGAALPPDSHAADLPDLLIAVRKLGLRLDKVTGVPVDVIVVDRVDEIPVAN
jgi:uncharacterized protein (TIGR03435 family)